MADFLINVIVRADSAVQAVDRVDRRLTGLERTLIRFQSLVGAAFSFLAVGQAVRAITTLADSLQNAQNRVRSLGIEGAALNGVIEQLFGIANRTRQEFATTAEVFTRTAASLKVLGLGAGEALRITESLNQAVALSGSTTAEASNALIQFSQGLASGTLRGDELRSVLEQIPVVADVIATQLGVTRNELRALAADGTITPEVIVQAFRNAENFLRERFLALIPTIGQAFVVLRNRVIEVGGGFLQTSGLAEAFSRAIIAIALNIETVLRVLTVVATVLGAGLGIPLVIGLLRALTVALIGTPFGAFLTLVTTTTGVLIAFNDQLKVTADGAVSFGTFASVAFGRFRDTAGDALSELIQKLPEAAAAFSGFGDEAELALNKITALFPALQEFATGFTLANFIQFVARDLDILVAIFADAFATLEAAFNNLGPLLGALFIEAINNLLEDAEEAVEFFLNYFNDQFINGLIDSAIESVTAFGAALKEGFFSLFRNLFSGNFTDLVRGDIQATVTDIGGEIQVNFGRLENPYAETLTKVAQAGNQAFEDTIRNAPISSALADVLSESREAEVAARLAGSITGNFYVDNFIRELENADIVAGAVRLVDRVTATVADEIDVAAQGRLKQAVAGFKDAFADLLNLDATQLGNLGTNLSAVFDGVFGPNLLAALGNGVQSILGFFDISNEQFANFGGAAAIILDELGFSIEDTFGPKAAAVIRIFGRLSIEQLTSIYDTALDVFSGIGTLITSLVPGAQAAFTAIATAFEGATASASAFGAALGPIAVILAGFATFVNGVLALVDAFGLLEGVLLSIINLTFTQFIGFFEFLGFDATAVVEDLIAFFTDFERILLAIVTFGLSEVIRLFGDLGGVVEFFGDIFGAVFDGVVAVFQFIVDLITGIIDLFTGGGGLGNALEVIGVIFAAVFAPIIVTVQLVIELIQFLADLINFDLSGAFNFLGGIAVGVFNAIAAAGEFLFGLLSGLVNGFLALATGAFNAIQAAATTVFNAIQAVITSVFGIIRGIVQGFVDFFIGAIQGAINVVTGAFNAFRNVASAAFNAVAGAAGALLGAINAVIQAVRAAINAVGGLIDIIGKIPGIPSVPGLPGFNPLNFVAGPIAGPAISGGKKLLNAGKKALKKLNPFAEGGVITEPIGLFGAKGFFQRGGVLNEATPFRALRSLGLGATATADLGIAGERGPEAILPLSSTSRGLGVRAVLPQSFVDQLNALANRLSRAGENEGTTVIQNREIFVVQANDPKQIAELQRRIDEQTSNAATISGDTTLDILEDAFVA